MTLYLLTQKIVVKNQDLPSHQEKLPESEASLILKSNDTLHNIDSFKIPILKPPMETEKLEHSTEPVVVSRIRSILKQRNDVENQSCANTDKFKIISPKQMGSVIIDKTNITSVRSLNLTTCDEKDSILNLPSCSSILNPKYSASISSNTSPESSLRIKNQKVDSTDSTPSVLFQFSKPRDPESSLRMKNQKVDSTDSASSVPFQFQKPRDPDHDKLLKLNFSIDIIEESRVEIGDTLLGRGAQGSVYKGKYLGTEVAIQIIQKGKQDREILKEIKLLNDVNHPNIVLIMAVCLTKTQYYLVT